MTPNDILTLVFGLIGGAILFWVIMRTRKDSFSEDLK